jgi:hypothetical protein
MATAPVPDRRVIHLTVADREHVATVIRRIERIRFGEATKFDRSAGRLYADLVGLVEIVSDNGRLMPMR